MAEESKKLQGPIAAHYNTAVQCNLVQCSVLKCSAVQCSTVLCSAVRQGLTGARRLCGAGCTVDWTVQETDSHSRVQYCAATGKKRVGKQETSST